MFFRFKVHFQRSPSQFRKIINAFNSWNKKAVKDPLEVCQVISRLPVTLSPGWEGGGGLLPLLPIMDYTGRLRPKGFTFFRLAVYKWVGISRVGE